jgi:hypothetical protein
VDPPADSQSERKFRPSSSSGSGAPDFDELVVLVAGCRTARAYAPSVSAEMHSGCLAIRDELPQDIRARRRRDPSELSEACRGQIRRIEDLCSELPSCLWQRGFLAPREIFDRRRHVRSRRPSLCHVFDLSRSRGPALYQPAAIDCRRRTRTARVHRPVLASRDNRSALSARLDA